MATFDSGGLIEHLNAIAAHVTRQYLCIFLLLISRHGDSQVFLVLGKHTQPLRIAPLETAQILPQLLRFVSDYSFVAPDEAVAGAAKRLTEDGKVRGQGVHVLRLDGLRQDRELILRDADAAWTGREGPLRKSGFLRQINIAVGFGLGSDLLNRQLSIHHSARLANLLNR